MSIRVVRSQHVHGDWWYQTLVVDPFMWKNVRYLGAEFFPMIRWLWFENKTWGSKGLLWISTFNRQHQKRKKKRQNIQRIFITFTNPHKHKTVIIHIINPRAKSFESQTTNPNHQFPFWNNNYKKSWKKKTKQPALPARELWTGETGTQRRSAKHCFWTAVFCAQEAPTKKLKPKQTSQFLTGIPSVTTVLQPWYPKKQFLEQCFRKTPTNQTRCICIYVYM